MSEWNLFCINEIGEIITGTTPNTKNNLFWNGHIPFYTPGDLTELSFCRNTEKHISKEALITGRPIPEKSILVTCIGSTIGKVAINFLTGLTNQQINSIIPNSKFDNFFVYYVVAFNSDTIKNLAPQTAVPIINKTEFGKLKFRFPSLSTQQKIAKILSTTDAVIEKTQAAIAKYKAIKQGLLQDLFTRGIDLATNQLRPSYKDAPELYKESKLGWIPEKWDIEKLDQICSMKSGEGITSSGIFEMEDFPVYGGNGLRGYTNSYTHHGEFTLIGRQGALCGNITRVSGKFYASEHAVVVTVKNETDVDWLSQKLDTMNLNQYSEASAQPGLSVNKILQLPVSKPPFKEQQKIAERLISIDNKLQTEQTYLQKLQQIKRGLMEDLLSGRKKLSEG